TRRPRHATYTTIIQVEANHPQEMNCLLSMVLTIKEQIFSSTATYHIKEILLKQIILNAPFV
ncbi:MAG TPA: hypothetical protein PKH98_02555, partial [Candidatus Omnitrophota bacterium]|nr:hypothetical protein [Candidatus Omnitrophota bacterium]